jgi:hypothetical protein
MALIDSIGSFLSASAKKKQTKNIIRDYTAAEAGAGTARDATLGYFQPYAQGGQTGFQNALNMQSGGFEYKPTDPSYKWRFDQGMDAAMRGASAAGTIGSGGTLKALTRYGQGFASTEFGNDFDRNNQLAKFGFNAAQGQAGAQNSYVNALFNAADGRSGARMQRADAIGDQWGSAVSGVKDIAAFFL